MAKKKAKPVFTQISPNEVKIKYREQVFILEESNRGTWGLGRAIGLKQLVGLEKKYIKEVGWTKSDNHGNGGMKEALITNLTNMEACKVAAIKYIDLLLD